MDTREALERAIAYCDAAQHSTSQYADEREQLIAALAAPPQAQEPDRATLIRVIDDIYDALGCNRDNESALEEIQRLRAAVPAGAVALDRQWVIDLIHNEYDPMPDLGCASYRAFEDTWDDGSGRIADAIITRISRAPSDGAKESDGGPLPRGGIEPDWHAESVKLYRQNRDLRKALQQQHDWHLAQGDKDFGDGITLNMADEYSDSGMCERTVAALNDVLPTGIAGYEAWKARPSDTNAPTIVADRAGASDDECEVCGLPLPPSGKHDHGYPPTKGGTDGK